MRIQALRIENYKGFDDSEAITFGPGFNVIVGQNNAGKTAILEALRLSRAPDRPHRTIELPVGAPLPSKSNFRLSLTLSGEEFEAAILRTGNARLPLPHEHRNDPQIYLDYILKQDLIQFSILFPGADASPSPMSSPLLFLDGDVEAWRNQSRMVSVQPSQDRRRLVSRGVTSGEESTVHIVSSYAQEKIYVFDAQRLNVGLCNFGDSEVLLPNASNLPQVLLKMTGNPERYERFNRHVTEIFPNIHHVAVVPAGSSLEIRIWPVPVETERADLASPLNEGGTGVGQILAILYVAMNFERSVIAIDEPNNFLHPGAVKKLINILQDYGTNQYIVATHSTDVIASSDPSTLHTVSWSGGRSQVDSISTSNLSNLRFILSDLGVSLSDVFGPDQIVWVEGVTEQECFPIICRHADGSVPKGLSFLALRNTGDVERNNGRADAMIELYDRVSGAGSIMPPVLAFSFDRELRSPQDVKDLQRRRIRTRVLPRRTYENYLLNAEAIAWVISEELSTSCDAREVESWINANRSRYFPKLAERWDGDHWLNYVDAPRLLASLFQALTDSKLEYKKVRHSSLLTSHLLEQAPSEMAELVNYVNDLISNARDA